MALIATLKIAGDIMEALKRAEERIMQAPVEHMVVVSQDDVERGEVIGTSVRVDLAGHINEGAIEAHRPIATHNHPGKHPIVMLSWPDVATSFMMGFSEMRAVNRYGLVYAVSYPPLPTDVRKKIALTMRLVAIGSGALGMILMPVSIVCMLLGICRGCLMPVYALTLAVFFLSNIVPVWFLQLLMKYHKLPAIRWGYTSVGERI